MDEAVGSPQTGPVSPPGVELDRAAAFSAFYRQEMPRLVAFLLAMGGGLHDAKDAAQEAMRLAYSGWDTIGNPRAWTRTVASREYFRRILAQQEDPVEDLPEVPGHDDVAEAAVIGQEQSRILKLLLELPPRQRQVMAWTLDGYRPKEIAGLLEITPDDVRVTLHKARQSLRERLAREGGRSA